MHNRKLYEKRCCLSYDNELRVHIPDVDQTAMLGNNELHSVLTNSKLISSW